VTVLPQAELEERGMGLIAAVGKGSARPPVMTVIESAAGSQSPLGLVGKGVIFDSGGLNLKSTANMLLMRKDMAGAATVIGALEAIGQLQLAVPFVAVIPAAENSVGPQSYRPGDILTSLEGLTVEISNTDAEGRLLLADGLTLARQRGCRHLVDVATLTGSARIALGPDVPALFGSDEQLVTWLLEESRRADEPVWRLPLVEHYDRQLDSPWADVNHISSDARGGAITAALFLQRFSGGLPWAHMDLYGWEDQGKPETPKGANGMLVRTLVGLLQRFSAHIAK
jgi:leucyl aminopeptidase